MTIVILMGIQGSGKSEFYRRYFKDVKIDGYNPVPVKLLKRTEGSL